MKEKTSKAPTKKAPFGVSINGGSKKVTKNTMKSFFKVKKAPRINPLNSEEMLKEPQKKFGGLNLETVLKMKLPDRIAPDLDFLFIGINPSPQAAYHGHHYVGNNHMWKCLFISGLIDEKLTAFDDVLLPQKYKIGFTTIVERTTPRMTDLKSVEIVEGGEDLLRKIQELKPKIAVFNGKLIYEKFAKKVLKMKKVKVLLGRQQDVVVPGSDTRIYAMPSTSALCQTYPTAETKAPFFEEAKQWLAELKDSSVHKTDA